MSGGAWNYVCFRVEEIAENVEDAEIKALIKDLSKLLHDEEWYESGDYGRSDYLETLEKFKKKWFKSSREERLVGIINEELDHFKNKLNELV